MVTTVPQPKYHLAGLWISSISPASPGASWSEQRVRVTGQGFQPGLTLSVMRPNGEVMTLAPSLIQNLTTTGFDVTLQLSGGPNRIWVTNRTWVSNTWEYEKSNEFAFMVGPILAISSLSPETLIASKSEQSVRVNGSAFREGLSVALTLPSGARTTLAAQQLQNVTDIYFDMLLQLGAGHHELQVINPNGEPSNPFRFSVWVAAISSISPASPVASWNEQWVQVSGSAFQPGFTVSVRLPSGQVTTLAPSQIENMTESGLDMILRLGAGIHRLWLADAAGATSNGFSFTVQEAPAPVISSISPARPASGARGQTVRVNGANFQAGLSVTLNARSTSSPVTIAPEQIRNITPTAFETVLRFETGGFYNITVHHPDGKISNTFGFTVS